MDISSATAAASPRARLLFVWRLVVSVFVLYKVDERLCVLTSLMFFVFILPGSGFLQESSRVEISGSV